MKTPLHLEGEWTIARAAELKACLSEPASSVVVDLTRLERIDLAVLQCLLVAHVCGRVEHIVDPLGLLHREAERHGLWSHFTSFTSL